ncbi:hypothetical protein BA70_09425 [Bacillus zhangzhouensis]|uniref:Uncharacterized protein n=1 Tax=Bacillus zhangzhouensis TaxID=1178540 RepID=A0A081L7U9_9BACI|nr:hypothetical protein [Bacillus zhangzhouensis]KEP25325.1 hypothetical protein BA70_09425 [Bacillus zhangzhouensis]
MCSWTERSFLSMKNLRYQAAESGVFPRDTNLSPKERVNCQVGPVIDPVILGLSAEEKRD